MNNLKQVKLQGGYYKDSTDIQLFTVDANKVSIIYGVNGSGKSCISKAIGELKLTEDDIKTYSVNELYDSSNMRILPNEIDESAINVFDEDFIENNIKLNKDSLDAIIMFGEQGEYDTQIIELQKKLTEIRSQVKAIDLSKYEDDKTTHSIVKKRKNISDSLKNGWAVREKEIRNLPRNASVTDNLIEEISKMLLPKDSRVQLSEELDKLNIIIQNARSNSEKILIDEFVLKNIDEKKLINLLNEKIEKPGSNVLEIRILETIENKGKEFIEHSKHDFSDNNTKYCPYCFQNVDEKHKIGLIESVRKIFSDEVEKHSQLILDSTIERIEINLDSARIIDNELVDKFLVASKLCNEKIDIYNENLEKKADNVFEPIAMTSQDLNGCMQQTNEIYGEITNKVDFFNKSIEEIQINISRAQELNKSIAKLETKSLYNELDNTLKEYNKFKSDLLDLSTKRATLEKDIARLNSKKSSVDIALELINHYLALIFGDSRRLTLELSENNDYFVKSKNRKLKLKNLSVGERNAIALCYFFSQLQKETTVDSSFCQKFFLVLDDPISSFDFDNKIGIYSFLNMIFEKVLLGNQNSRAILFSHEIEVILNLNKVLEDVKKVNNFDNSVICTRIINSDKTTSELNVNKFNSYFRLLNDIYMYATSQDVQEKLDYTIGNIIRKALEAFSTFQFRSGIENLYRDEDIISLISGDKQKAYFKSRMNRIVMHGESHTGDSVKNIVSRSTLEYFSTIEKIQVAKDVLAFMYLLYSRHIELYFKDDQSKIRNIKAWSEAPLDL